MAENTDNWDNVFQNASDNGQEGQDAINNPGKFTQNLPPLAKNLISMYAGLQAANKANISPLGGAGAGFQAVLAGGAGGAQAQADIAQQEKQMQLAQLDSMPLEKTHPEIVNSYPFLKGLSMGQFRQVGPTLAAFQKQHKDLVTPEDENYLLALGAKPEDIGSYVGQNKKEVVTLLTKKTPTTGTEWTPEAISLAASQYLIDKTVPTFGMGASSARGAFYNEAARQAAEQGLTAQSLALKRASYAADKASLAKLTNVKDQTLSFEKQARKNIQLADTMAKKVDAKGNTIFNKWWLNRVKGQYAGDKDVENFQLALTAATKEYAKVISGGAGSVQALSDSANQEINDLINKGQSYEAFRQKMDIMLQEMDNRRSSYDEQMAEINARINPNSPTIPANVKSENKSGKAPKSSADKIADKFGFGD